MIRGVQFVHRLPAACCGFILLWAATAGGKVSAQTVILHLKDGDRISGRIVAETTNQVVLSNAWAGAVSIPLAEISNRETIKSAPPPTTSPVAAKPASPPGATSSVKQPVKSKGAWHGQANLGLDAIFSTVNSQNYSGSLKLTYERPYLSDPKQFFRNTSQVHGEYQRTDGQESANRADASNKSDFDLSKRFYGYGLFGVGYDDVQHVDFQYQVSPGGGVHVIQGKKFVLNTEGGMDYETQYRRNAATLEMLSARLAEDATWNIRKNMTLSENEAFYPDVQNGGQFRNDWTTTLSYGFWKNLSLNLTVDDHYNSEVAPGVDPNQFEIRSSLGVTF
ncbi:MAG: DUF481 domain-containing protein [Verrucomicrobia bacterium]|nr:DUF481 domain-containing protein [Verrucomicrobiota bacterium]